jgi:AcrR family transcriptional regulator
MGRKSLKTEKISTILDAFEHCVVEKGLQSTTLDNIAEQAGMARRMVRHYVGNRSDLINAGVVRIIEKFQQNVDTVTDHANEAERFDIAFNYIFSEEFNSLPATRLVAALLPVGLYDKDVQLAVKSIYDFFQASLEKELKQHRPLAKKQEIQQVAYTVMCLSFGGGWMRNIGFDPELNLKNKQLASTLIDQLP